MMCDSSLLDVKCIGIDLLIGRQSSLACIYMYVADGCERIRDCKDSK